MPLNKILVSKEISLNTECTFQKRKRSKTKLITKMMRQQQTNKAIKRGDRILTESPFVFVLKSKYQKERCDNCLIECKPKKCSNCYYVYYCSRSCQMDSWNLHKIECPFLKRIYPRTVPDAARILSRIIIKLKNGGDMERGYYTENEYRRFRDLMSHYAEIKNDSQRLEHLESLHAIISEMMVDSTIVPNQTELLSIYGRLITNGFNILDAEMNSIATAIYLGVSVTDHSCKPNAVATFEGTTLHIHATEDMPCLDWSKIFISYIDLLNTSEQRRKDLMMSYYFLCTCSKCIDPRESFEMNAAACPKKNCTEYVDINSFQCLRCGTGINPKYRNDFNDAMLLTKSHFESVKDVAYLDVSKVCLKKQKGYVHALNIWHIKTLDAAFEASIEVGKWSEALDYGNELFAGFRKYYGEWNPLLGLLHMKVAKIQLYQGAPKEALRNFQQAQNILEVTHGRDHTLLRKQLEPLIIQAREESNSHVY